MIVINPIAHSCKAPSKLKPGYKIPEVVIRMDKPASGCLEAVNAIRESFETAGVRLLEAVDYLNTRGYSIEREIFAPLRSSRWRLNPDTDVSGSTIGTICFLAYAAGVSIKFVMATPHGDVEVVNRGFDLWPMEGLLSDLSAHHRSREPLPDEEAGNAVYEAIKLSVKTNQARKLGKPEGYEGWDLSYAIKEKKKSK